MLTLQMIQHAVTGVSADEIIEKQNVFSNVFQSVAKNNNFISSIDNTVCVNFQFLWTAIASEMLMLK